MVCVYNFHFLFNLFVPHCGFCLQNMSAVWLHITTCTATILAQGTVLSFESQQFLTWSSHFGFFFFFPTSLLYFISNIASGCHSAQAYVRPCHSSAQNPLKLSIPFRVESGILSTVISQDPCSPASWFSLWLHLLQLSSSLCLLQQLRFPSHSLSFPDLSHFK